MTILAIDPGTKLGWAVWRDGDVVAAGTEDLTPSRNEGHGMRYVRLSQWLWETDIFYGPFTMLVYEEVRHHAGTNAAHVYGGLVGIIAHWCEDSAGCQYTSAPVGTVKKHATGKGNAGKAAMIEAARERWPDFSGDDNEADARWIADWAARQFAGAKA